MEIGQRVSWTIKDKQYTGLFYENLTKEFSRVKCLTQNNRIFIINTLVLTELIQSI
jgi:hypothetical protein